MLLSLDGFRPCKPHLKCTILNHRCDKLSLLVSPDCTQSVLDRLVRADAQVIAY